MIYYTTRQSPEYKQMTLEELMFGAADWNPIRKNNVAATRTVKMDDVTDKMRMKYDFWELELTLTTFNTYTESLRQVENRKDLYNTFAIPKKSGGLRWINAPCPELMTALSNLKTIFETKFGALYHTSTFAYVKHRDTLEAIRKHQSNESKWFAKFDLHDFFGSTTLPFVMHMLSMIFPFSEVMKTDTGRKELETALELGFLDGALPQGTPLSPMLTNLVMIPIDFETTNRFREHPAGLVNTRYADDYIISSKYDFKFTEAIQILKDVYMTFGAPYQLNEKKTRYGSANGQNWNLGVMLNKDNEITIGYKNKRWFKSMLVSYIKDSKNGVQWDKHDVMSLFGKYNHYHHVEEKPIEALVDFIDGKYGVHVLDMMKEDIRG